MINPLTPLLSAVADGAPMVVPAVAVVTVRVLFALLILIILQPAPFVTTAGVEVLS